MVTIMLVPVLVAVVGVLIYALAANPKVSMIGLCSVCGLEPVRARARIRGLPADAGDELTREAIAAMDEAVEVATSRARAALDADADAWRFVEP